MTLADFLLARLAEDEAAARDVWRRPHLGSCNTQGDLSSLRDECDCGFPARVLAECAAKRRVVVATAATVGASAVLLTNCSEILAERAEEVLRLLALPYVDHPDYRDEWKP